MNYIYNSSGHTRKFTGSMQEVLESHFNKLNKFLSDAEPIKVSLDKEGDIFILKCQVVSKNNKRVRTEFRGEDYYQLISESYEALRKQLNKRKEKSYLDKRLYKQNFDSSEYEQPLFARNKKFILSPMRPERAIDEMNTLGHEWYAFRDIDNFEKISVVYRRFDNTFGIVELI